MVWHCARSTTSPSIGTCWGSTSGVMHIADRLREVHGPMLRTELQGFHGEAIAVPRRPAERPDPQRLASRFERFLAAAT